MTDKQKKILLLLYDKPKWLREQAIVRCSGVYSNANELVRGFAVLWFRGLLGVEKENGRKIKALWLTNAGFKVVESIKPNTITYPTPCRQNIKVCYHADKCYLAVYCNAAK